MLPRIDLMVEQDLADAAGNWHIVVRNTRAAGDGTRVARSAANLATA